MSEVKFVKLSTGEEFFTTVEEGTVNKQELVMTNSVVAVDNGQGGLSFVPYLPFVADRSFTVHESDVMIIESPIPEILDSYNQNFGSGIITPPEKKIIAG